MGHLNGNNRTSGHVLVKSDVSATASLTENVFSSYDEKADTSYDEKILIAPSEETYGLLTGCWRLLNQECFDNSLQEPVITLQRKGRALGYFSGDRFMHDQHETLTDEIALNPAMQAGRSFKEMLSTLVHEMCHAWQFHWSAFECRRGTMRAYHDREWGEKMISLGLMPSDTGKAGGKKTGRQMSHYIIQGGLFEKFAEKLSADGYDLHWREWVTTSRRTGGLEDNNDEDLKLKPIDPSKVKYTCGNCNQNAWAKSSAKLACLNCGGLPMVMNT